jgi:hypothetical protein
LFAKLLSAGTVVRGGFRINFVNDEYVKAASTLVGGNPGLGAVNTGVNNLAAALTPRGSFTGIPSISTLPTFTLQPRTFAQNNTAANGASRVFGVDPNVQVPLLYDIILESREISGSKLCSKQDTLERLVITLLPRRILTRLI